MLTDANTDAILLHFSGPDQAGQTAELMAELARFRTHLLDLGQAVVHETLSLGVLLEVEGDAGALRTAMHDRAHALGLTVRWRLVERGALRHWSDVLRQEHFIVTLLGRAVTAEQLARVAAVVAGHGMNIERIERMSAELTPEAGGNACVELAISGPGARELSMRAAFMEAAQALSIDIAFQRESIFRRNRRLFAFDMDSTLIQGEVIDELAKMAGVGEQVAKITESAMRGELNFDESFTRRVALLKGLPAERVMTLLEAIPLAEGAERLIRTLRLLGYKTAILSGGFTFFARALQAKLGIDFIHANELEMQDGVVTGRVIPPVVNGARKAALLEEIAGREGISLEQAVAVGDGANDIPMLNLAGMGIAYRAKPLVRRSADQALSTLGLDGLLYLLGVRDLDLARHAAEAAEG